MRYIRDKIKQLDTWVITEGTLKTEDLIASIYQFLKDTKVNCEYLIEDIKGYFTAEPTISNVYDGTAKIKPGLEVQAEYMLHEELYNFMCSIAPDGYYFGSHEGDGACIGFFRCN